MAARFIPEPPSIEKLQAYASYAKTLRRVCAKKRDINNLNGMATVIYAAFIIEFLADTKGSVGSHTRVMGSTTNRLIKSITNRLESAIQGYTGKYINEEVLKQEVTVCITELKAISKSLNEKFDAKAITSIIGKNDLPAATPADDSRESTSAKFNSFEQMGEYLKQFEDVSSNLDKIEKEVKKPEANPQPENDPEDDEQGLTINQRPIDKKAVMLEDTFKNITKAIHIPSLSQDKPWVVARLPIFIMTTPFLSENVLRMNGIKFHRLPVGLVLENQLVLCLYTRYKGDPATDKNTQNASIDKSLNPVFSSPLFIRANNMIRHNLNEEILYSDPFSSPEVAKPIQFLWMLTPKMVSTFGRFKIKSIGLPYAPELREGKDVTMDGLKIKEDIQKESEGREEFIRNRNEALAPLLKERDRLRKSYEENRLKARDIRKQIGEYNLAVQSLTTKLSKVKKGSEDYMAAKLQLEAAQSKLNRLNMDLAGLLELFIPLVKAQTADLQIRLNDFVKKYGSSKGFTR